MKGLKKKYHFEQKLGERSFGEVWLATTKGTNQAVAIKLVIH